MGERVCLRRHPVFVFLSVFAPRAEGLVEGDAVQIIVEAREDQLLLGVIILPLGIKDRQVSVETGFEGLA
jgi:hypothetical protein